MKNIWHTLKKPIFALAPMEDVTDTVFRRIVIDCGKPDIFFTEFTNCDGLFSKGRKDVIQRLKFEKDEKPIIAQIWGADPSKFYEAAKLLSKMGFAGIDINMGCPQKKVTKKGACAALIKNPNLAKEIIDATKKGASGLPVSVKTRIGYNEIQTEDWIKFLLEQKIDALTVHLRTKKEESTPPAHWEEMRKITQIKKSLKSKTIILGNGDIKTIQEGKEKIKEYDLDGFMIGRGIFLNPWVFNENININKITTKQRLSLLLKHVDLYDKTWGKNKNFNVMKKYFKIYISNFDGASNMRIKLMETKNAKEAKSLIQNLAFSYQMV
ncbi:MAG: tRNA-dihydrouridine synthase [Patescibacteria group bacterium]|nr:tRNA-dihydrouridine synthase [Patescibacteria group bacterium]